MYKDIKWAEDGKRRISIGEEEETHSRSVSTLLPPVQQFIKLLALFPVKHLPIRDCVHPYLTYGNVDKQQAFIQLACVVYIAEHTYVIFSLRQSGNDTNKFKLQPVMATASF